MGLAPTVFDAHTQFYLFCLALPKKQAIFEIEIVYFDFHHMNLTGLDLKTQNA